MYTITNIHVSAAALLATEKTALDSANEQLLEGRIEGALDELFEDLRERREEKSQDWPAYTRACLNHPVCRLLHQDPFTYRAFAKPRGYAGDAVMMDYIYGLGEAGQAARNATPLDRSIFEYMDTRPSAKAVRYRRRLIAGLIDRVAERQAPGVLAVAAGHLREVELSRAVQTVSSIFRLGPLRCSNLAHLDLIFYVILAGVQNLQPTKLRFNQNHAAKPTILKQPSKPTKTNQSKTNHRPQLTPQAEGGRHGVWGGASFLRTVPLPFPCARSVP